MDDSTAQSTPPTDTPTHAGPGAEHAMLEKFAGTWRARVAIFMEPGGEPMVSHGTMVNRLILDGRMLRHEFTGDAAEWGQFLGEGYWGYNVEAGRWEGVWVDIMSTQISTETGRMIRDGALWEMRGEYFMPGGQRAPKRTEVEILSPDEHHMRSYSPAPDGADGREFMHMEIVYTRD